MKHLVSLVDGTWLTPTHIGGRDTYSNIHRINLLLDKELARDGKPQIKFYSRGLGAISGIRRYTSGGFGYGLKEEVEDVYMNIASNYIENDNERDNIYLYGFSRGAAIVRVVAALISNVGLLKPWKLDFFPRLWTLYESGHNTERDGKPEFCHTQAEIEFLGLFDTVCGGNDTPARLKKRLGCVDKTLSKKIKNAIHILAIDEQRPFFRPLLWEESEDHAGLQQIWMPGVHGDIGGIYPNDFLGLISFCTMIEKTNEKTQLRFDDGMLNDLRTRARVAFIHENVSVSQEWSIGWRIVSLNKPHQRTPLVKGTSKQIRHTITDMIDGKDITMRNNKEKDQYVVPAPFSALPPMDKNPLYANWVWGARSGGVD
jgi:uncharacterized protein (DUF2235 family)